MARAREWVLERGGPTQANVFTKITLALFGQYPWGGVPAMPVEIMLLPRWSYFNVWEISYWSRTVLIPLLVVMDRRPVHPVPRDAGIDELWAHHLHLDDPAYARRGLVSWKNIFIGVDGFLKTWEAFGPRPWRGRAIRAAHDWLVPRMTVPGGLGGIYPAMVNGILAMRLLGYPDDHALIAGQIKEIEALGVEEPRRFHVQPCVSPVWDTALAVNALLASGAAALLTRRCSAPPTGSWTARSWRRETGRSSARGSSPAAGPSSSTTPSTPTSTTPRWSPWGSTRSTTRTTAGGAWPSSAPSGGSGACRARTAGWASFDTDQTRLLLQQHPVRRPRGAPRPGHRGPHRALHRVLRAARASRATIRRSRRGLGVPPPHPDGRGRVARALGRQLPLRDLVGPPGTRGDRAPRRRPHGRDAPSGGSRLARTRTAAGARPAIPTPTSTSRDAAPRGPARRPGRSSA